jgi:hypothetical protein
MEFLKSLSPELAAAIVAGSVALALAVPTAIWALVKFHSDNYLDRKVEKAVVRLLRNSKIPYVPLRIISHHIGGFSPVELRRVLVRVGALRFSDRNKLEHWALLKSIPRAERINLLQIKIPYSDSPPEYDLFIDNDGDFT